MCWCRWRRRQSSSNIKKAVSVTLMAPLFVTENLYSVVEYSVFENILTKASMAEAVGDFEMGNDV